MNRQSTRDFGGSDTILFDTIMAYKCDYTFVDTHSMYSTKSES